MVPPANERQITKTHYVQRSSSHPLAGDGIAMTAVVTVAPILVNVLGHIAHQVRSGRTWSSFLSAVHNGPMVRCAKLPASHIFHNANEKVHVDQRLQRTSGSPPSSFIVNTPKLHVDRHGGAIRQSRSPGKDRQAVLIGRQRPEQRQACGRQIALLAQQRKRVFEAPVRHLEDED